MEYVPEAAESAVVKAYLRVLHNLPTRPDEDPGDTFGFQQWMEGIRRAPRGSEAGGDGTRPDLIAELVHHSSDFADALYGYHSYMAHAPPGTGNCTQPFESKLQHGGWARVVYLLPRWLLAKPRGKRQVRAREIRGRIDSFMANEWKVLDKAARLAGTPPTVRTARPTSEPTTAVLSRQAINKNKREFRAKVIKRAVKMIEVGDLDRGARALGSPQYVITRRNCDEADPTGEVWSVVLDK